MKSHDMKEPRVDIPNPCEPSPATESGELEGPPMRRRRIDCGGRPEIAERQLEHRGGRRLTDLPRAG
jgi:hypothetical protein